MDWNTKFEDLDLSVRCFNSLIHYFRWEHKISADDLKQMSIADLNKLMNINDYRKCPNVGDRSIKEYQIIISEIEKEVGKFTGGLKNDQQIFLSLSVLELKQLIKETIKDCLK